MIGRTPHQMSLRFTSGWLLLLYLLFASGCSKSKSTDELLSDLASGNERERIIAVRLLPAHKGEATRVVPALAECLADKESDIRLSAAVGLGAFGEEARSAVPALQKAQRDRDARVRRAVNAALARIDPTLPTQPEKSSPK